MINHCLLCLQYRELNQLPVIGEKQNVEPFDLNSKSFGKEQLLFTNT